MQRSVDLAWQTVPQGLKDKLRAVAWLIGAGLIFAASFALSVLINFLPGFFAPLSIIAGLAVNVALFLWTVQRPGPAADRLASPPARRAGLRASASRSSS